MKLIKYFLGIICAFMFVSPSWATFTVNSAAGGNNGGGALTVSISIPAGHTAVVWLLTQGGTLSTSTLTDSNSDTPTVNAVGTGSSRNYGTAQFINLPSAITSVTFNGTSSTGARMVVWDVSATGTISVSSSANVQYAFNTTTTLNGLTSGTLALNGSDGLILAGWIDESAGGSTPGTVPPFVNDTASVLSSNGVIAEHYASSTSNPATFTGGVAGDFGELMAVMLQEAAPVVNGVLISNGHAVKSGSSIVYK